MDKNGFIVKMKARRKTPSTIKRYVHAAEFYEQFLSETKGKRIERGQPQDLDDFKKWGEAKALKGLRMQFMGLSVYYECINEPELTLKAKDLIGQIEVEHYRISNFQGVGREHVERLRRIGIKTAKHLLNRGRTKKGRAYISKSANVPLKKVLELVKLSDLARIPGVKKIRARLYVEAGLDTMEKIAACDSTMLRKKASDFIQSSNFDGVPPTPKEADHTITMAKYLKSDVEY